MAHSSINIIGLNSAKLNAAFRQHSRTAKFRGFSSKSIRASRIMRFWTEDDRDRRVGISAFATIKSFHACTFILHFYKKPFGLAFEATFFIRSVRRTLFFRSGFVLCRWFFSVLYISSIETIRVFLATQCFYHWKQPVCLVCHIVLWVLRFRLCVLFFVRRVLCSVCSSVFLNILLHLLVLNIYRMHRLIKRKKRQ